MMRGNRKLKKIAQKLKVEEKMRNFSLRTQDAKLGNFSDEQQ